MGEQEVVIRISAKNLTAAEFKKARQEVLGLGAETEKTRGKASALERGFKSFGKAAPGALRIVRKAAFATVGAIAGVTAAVIKLGERGAAVGDVKSAFDSLSLAVGETGETMLTALQKGVKGTISNFDLMKVANKALGTGLLSTSKDAKTLSEGARLLAKRTGGDTVQAFETLVTAMASGRTAQLKQIGLFVDNKKAIEDFAKATGTSVSQMTDADRATALQVATMAALRKELAGFPPPLSDFGELLERGRVSVKNFVDELAVMISESPVLISGLKAVGDAIEKTFGSNNQDKALAMTQSIERGAFFMIGLAQAGIATAGALTRGFAALKVVFFGVAFGISKVQSAVSETAATALEAAAKIPGLGVAYRGAAEEARAAADDSAKYTAELKENLTQAAIAAAGNSAFGQSLQRSSEALEDINRAMVNSGTSQRNLTTSTAGLTGGTNELSAAVVGSKLELQGMPPLMTEWQTKLTETGQTIATFRENVRQAFESNTQVTSQFGITVSRIGGQVFVQTRKMENAFKQFGLKTQVSMDLTAAQAKKNFELIEKSGKFTAKELTEIWQKYLASRREGTEQTTGELLMLDETWQEGATRIFQQAGANFKQTVVRGVALAIQAAIAKSLAAAPFPFNLALAAGAAAAGAIILNKVRSLPIGFKHGTPDSTFQDFGRGTATVLHGPEAVINQAGVPSLAEQIARFQSRMRPPTRDSDDRMGARLEAIVVGLEALPGSIERSVRDGVLLAV